MTRPKSFYEQGEELAAEYAKQAAEQAVLDAAREKQRCLARLLRNRERLAAPVKRELLPNAEAFDYVAAWQYGPDGLLLFGDSGRGKSISMMSLARRLLEEGREVRWISHDDFCRVAVDAAKGDCAWTEMEFVDGLAEVDVLFYDDVGEPPMTPVPARSFCSVLRKRGEAGRPIILSTQFATPERFVSTFKEPETRAKVARRLRDFFVSVGFD